MSEEQQKAYHFLVEHFQNQEEFTYDEFRIASGWNEETFNTNFSKKFKDILIEVSPRHYRVHGVFRKFLTWEKFQNGIVSQVRRIRTEYSEKEYPNVMIFEFFMPLTNENILKDALDSLFYKDVIINRLKTLKEELGDLFNQAKTDMENIEGLCHYISKIFVGYSIKLVNGRFRLKELATIEEASSYLKKSEKYLADETTAVVTFIIPVENINEYEKIKRLFFSLFLQNVLETVSGEDEIWLIERGMKNSLHIWEAM